MRLSIPNQHGDFELFERVLRAIVGNKKDSLIDMCCCEAPVTSKLGFKKRWFVDMVHRPIPDPEHFIQTNALGDHQIFSDHYDVATCLDGIEHFPKDLGWQLVDRMLKIADRAVIFTPSDPWMVEVEGSERWNDPASHKSIWNPEEFEGWASINYPHYHPALGIGAFFAWYCPNIDQDFLRVKQELGL